ncbi:MAG: DUF4412 domain-containing protein [Cyclobacteriaceae bacterium]
MKTFTLLSTTILAFTGLQPETISQLFSENNRRHIPEYTDDSQQTSTFEGVLEMQGLGGAVTYYIKGDKVRSEIKDEGQLVIFLYEFNGTSYTSIMPAEKIYMEAPVHQINFSDQELKEINDCESKISKTGEKLNISGITCEKWTANCGNDRSEVWVTRELGFEWGQLFHPMFRAAYTGSMQQYGELKGYFPMKMVVPDEKGKQTVFMEVGRLEKKKLSDELFSIPTGYKKMASR